MALCPSEAAAEYRKARDGRVEELVKQIGLSLCCGEFTVPDDLGSEDVMARAADEFRRAGWRVEAVPDLAAVRFTPARPIDFFA